MGTTVQSFSYVAGQRTDISSFAAHYADSDFRHIEPTVQQLYFINHQQLRTQVHFLTPACQVVCPLPIDHTCRKSGRRLPDFPCKLLQGFFHQLPRDMLRGISSIHLVLQVIAGSGSSQTQRSHVFFRMILKLLDTFGCLAVALYHHSRSQRVERSGVTHLQFLHSQLSAQLIAHMPHHLERCPTQRLVETQYFAFLEVHHHPAISNVCPVSSR